MCVIGGSRARERVARHTVTSICPEFPRAQTVGQTHVSYNTPTWTWRCGRYGGSVPIVELRGYVTHLQWIARRFQKVGGDVAELQARVLPFCSGSAAQSSLTVDSDVTNRSQRSEKARGGSVGACGAAGGRASRSSHSTVGLWQDWAQTLLVTAQQLDEKRNARLQLQRRRGLATVAGPRPVFGLACRPQSISIVRLPSDATGRARQLAM